MHVCLSFLKPTQSPCHALLASSGKALLASSVSRGQACNGNHRKNSRHTLRAEKNIEFPIGNCLNNASTLAAGQRVMRQGRKNPSVLQYRWPAGASAQAAGQRGKSVSGSSLPHLRSLARGRHHLADRLGSSGFKRGSFFLNMANESVGNVRRTGPTQNWERPCPGAPSGTKQLNHHHHHHHHHLPLSPSAGLRAPTPP